MTMVIAIVEELTAAAAAVGARAPGRLSMAAASAPGCGRASELSNSRNAPCAGFAARLQARAKPRLVSERMSLTDGKSRASTPAVSSPDPLSTTMTSPVNEPATAGTERTAAPVRAQVLRVTMMTETSTSLPGFAGRC